MNNMKVAKAVVKVLQLRLDTEIQLCSSLGTVQTIFLSFLSFNFLICKIRVEESRDLLRLHLKSTLRVCLASIITCHFHNSGDGPVSIAAIKVLAIC